MYFTYTSILAVALPLATAIRLRTLAVNVCILAAFTVVRGLRLDWATVLRDWGTLALALVGYREMGWFAPDVHHYTLEQSWIAWDRVVLGQLGIKAAIESLGPVVPILLELSYLLVYSLAPFCMAMIYLYRRRDAAEYFLVFYLAGLYLSYAQFPFWPSEPPRTVFPGDHEPLRSVVREWNLRIVGGAGIHTSVFPSAHVSGAFASAFAMWRIFAGKPWLRRSVLVYACLVSIATVYGRFHYAVDAFAGIAVAVAAVWIARWLLRDPAIQFPAR